MKNILATIGYTLRVLIVLALTLTVASCGDDDEYPIDTTPIVGDTPPEAVDLGLPSGTKWAARDINNSGYYVAWGELFAKRSEDCTWANYRFGSPNAFTKYCFRPDLGKDGYTDEAVLGRKLTELEPVDDIARQQWGEGWRIPSKEQWQELFDNCDFYDSQQENKVIFESKRNHNSIVLTAQGYAFNGGIDLARCYYWTRTFHESFDSFAYYILFDFSFYFDPYSYLIGFQTRAYGMSIRPVKEN